MERWSDGVREWWSGGIIAEYRFFQKAVLGDD
jgi:hypothetical protein